MLGRQVPALDSYKDPFASHSKAYDFHKRTPCQRSCRGVRSDGDRALILKVSSVRSRLCVARADMPEALGFWRVLLNARERKARGLSLFTCKLGALLPSTLPRKRLYFQSRPSQSTLYAQSCSKLNVSPSGWSATLDGLLCAFKLGELRGHNDRLMDLPTWSESLPVDLLSQVSVHFDPSVSP